MTRLRMALARLAGLFQRKRREQELDEELRAHLEMLVEENLRKGMQPEEAWYAALRAFGGIEQVKEVYRERRGLAFIETLFQDVRYGVRQLRHAPGFTTVAIVTLALGIGATTAILSFVDAVLLNPLPYPHPEQIVIVFEEPPSGGLSEVSAPDFLDWKRQSTVFTAIAAEDWGTKTLTDAGVPVDLSSESVSANYFEIPGGKAQLGRTFAPDGAGLLIRSFYRLLQVNPGFDAANVITMGLPLAPEQYPDGPRIINYQEQVLAKIQAVPGVRKAAITQALPLEGWGIGMPFLIEGKPFVNMASRPVCGFKRVSPSYLATLRMRLLKGRWIAETDGPGTLPVAVINETMAQRYFRGRDPIGQRILIPQITRPPSSSSRWVTGQPPGPEIAWQVVGVAEDEKLSSLDLRYPALYVSYKQSPTLQTWLAVRGTVRSAHLVKSIQAAVWQLNKYRRLTRSGRLMRSFQSLWVRPAWTRRCSAHSPVSPFCSPPSESTA